MALLRPGLACLSTVVALALAGCVGGDSKETTAEETVETAAVTGRIIDDALSPIAGATVAILHQNLTVQTQTVTADDGRFDLGRIPAGTWVFTATALGFHEASRPLSLVAGIDQDVTLTLTAIPVAEAYYEVVPGSIVIQYGVSYSIMGDFNRGCIQPGVTCQSYAYPSANIQFHADDPKAARLQTVVLEEVWTSNSPICAKSMAIDLYNPDAPSTTNPTVGNPHYWTNSPSEKWKTTSPIIMTIPRAEQGNTDAIDDPARIEANGKDALMVRGNWTVRHFPPGSGLTNLPVDVNCFTDQRFDLYWSSFYLEAAPEGYSARPS